MALAVVTIREILDVTFLSARPDALVVGIAVVVAASGDVWAIARDRLYPFGLHRQTPKSLHYRGLGDGIVSFVYGVDVGLGFTTYRVTSGVWVVTVLVLCDVVPGWLFFAYAAGFACSFVAVAAWPAHGSDVSSRVVNLHGRITRLFALRRLAQVAYLGAVIPVAILGFASTP